MKGKGIQGKKIGEPQRRLSKPEAPASSALQWVNINYENILSAASPGHPDHISTVSLNPRDHPTGLASSGLKIAKLLSKAWLFFPSVGTQYALRATQSHRVYLPFLLCNDQFLLSLIFSGIYGKPYMGTIFYPL